MAVYIFCKLSKGLRIHARMKVRHEEGKESALCGANPASGASWEDVLGAGVDCPKCKGKMKSFNGSTH